MLGGESSPCPPYGRATLGTLQLMRSVIQPRLDLAGTVNTEMNLYQVVSGPLRAAARQAIPIRQAKRIPRST